MRTHINLELYKLLKTNCIGSVIECDVVWSGYPWYPNLRIRFHSRRKYKGYRFQSCTLSSRERKRERESIFQFSSIFTVRRYIYEYRPNTRIHRFYERSSMEQWLKFISQLSKWSYILTNIKVEVMNQTFYWIENFFIIIFDTERIPISFRAIGLWNFWIGEVTVL